MRRLGSLLPSQSWVRVATLDQSPTAATLIQLRLAPSAQGCVSFSPKGRRTLYPRINPSQVNRPHPQFAAQLRIARIARRATTIFPCLSGVNVTRTWGCLRVMTPDGSPIYERSPTFPDAFAVAAHSGITLAPHHVGMLAHDILDGGYGETLQAFSKARFGGDRSNIAISEH